jgi:hypothetical protein
MITPEDRRTLVEKLDQHRQALLTEVAARTEAAMAGRQKPGDRTFKAMLDHLATTERHYVDDWARRARDEDEPDVGRPVGGEAPMHEEANELSVPELLARLEAARAVTLRFIAETADGEFDRLARNTSFGDLTVHQFLKSLYRHDQMHLDEMLGRESEYNITTLDGRRL